MFLSACTLAVCECRAAIGSLDILWKMRDTSSTMGLFLAPTVSNCNWCLHAFQFAAATCQYFLCPLKILIVIKRIKGGGKKQENSEKPSNQSTKIGHFESKMNFYTAF